MKTKRKILSAFALLGTIYIAEAQIYTPGSTIQGGTTNQNVGIGPGTTSTPAFKLTVKTTGANDGIQVLQTGTSVPTSASALRLDNASPGGHNWGILSTSGTVQTPTADGNTQGGGRLLFYDYSVSGGGIIKERMIIDEKGYVGIGVGNTAPYSYLWTPKTKLHVHNGSIKLSGTDQVYGAPNIFWGGNTGSAADGEWALEYNTNVNLKGLNFWRPFGSHNKAGVAQSTVNNVLFLSDDNNVGIHTANPTAPLTVNGYALIGDPSVITSLPSPAIVGGYRLYVQDGILTEKVKVALHTGTDWADFVFAPNYKLSSINEVESYINENQHLPNVPSTSDVLANGVDLAKMDATLLRQVEELWLHVIELKKENEELKKLLKKD